MWGRAYSKWSEPYMPNFSLEFFSPEKGQASLKLMGSGKKAIWKKTLTLDQGYNVWNYDLTLTEDEFKSLKKANLKGLSPGEQGLIFLPKGTYKLQLSFRGLVVESNLIIN